MEDLQSEGKAKSIGVSNYRIRDLEETLKGAKVNLCTRNSFIAVPRLIFTPPMFRSLLQPTKSKCTHMFRIRTSL